MHSPDGRYDLLGQIYFTGFGIPIPVKCKTPAELDSIVHPFTMSCRGTIMCTPETMTILKNLGLPVSQQMEIANKLIAPHGLKLEAYSPELIARNLSEFS